MSAPHTARQVLDREFLSLRAKILELAASLDRMGRAEGAIKSDPRWELLRRGLEVLSDPAGDGRAEEIQLIFSLDYDPQWRKNLKVRRGKSTAAPKSK